MSNSQLDCNGMNRKIVFAGLDWSSAQLHNHIAGTILQAGFGCEFMDAPGSNIPMIEKLIRGDIDLHMEIWFYSVPSQYHRAVSSGHIVDLGLNMKGLEVSFMVPRYVIEGDTARGIAPMAPNLKSVTDLPKYVSLFADPEQPGKGRFNNCPTTWQCHGVNNDKMAAYGLNPYFNSHTNTASELDTSLIEAYESGKPWVGYYWSPSWIFGHYDMVILEEPAYSDDCWNSHRGCAFPPSIVNIAASKKFAEGASKAMTAFLRSYEMDQSVVSGLLAFMKKNNKTASDAAHHFLKTREDVWSTWVSAKVASRIRTWLHSR